MEKAGDLMDTLSRKSKARKTTFKKVDIVHEQRSANVDAHNLARSSIYFQLGRHVWFQAPPDVADGVNVIVEHV
jgi:hypothetical protein